MDRRSCWRNARWFFEVAFDKQTRPGLGLQSPLILFLSVHPTGRVGAGLANRLNSRVQLFSWEAKLVPGGRGFGFCNFKPFIL